MAVVVEVIEDGEVEILEVESAATTIVEVTDTTAEVVEVNTAIDPVVVEVLAGIPGSPNVYIGETPPPVPFEGQIWIDISA